MSVRHGSLKSHVGLRARCEAAPQLLGKGPGFVLYALMDFIVDQYFPIVEALEEQLEGSRKRSSAAGSIAKRPSGSIS